jgi:hypothetical protein
MRRNWKLNLSKAGTGIVMKNERKNFGGLGCVGDSFAYGAYFVFLGGVWIRFRELT